MPLVKEIAESIKLLGDVIASTRAFVAAVNDGRAYLKRYHPEAMADLIGLLRQMQKAIEGLATVTKVIVGFRFVTRGDGVDLRTAERDLRRFNAYLIAQREKIAALQGRIRDLKARCDKVRVLRDKLDARTKTQGWGSMFELFGSKARRRSQELASSLSNFYADDQRMIDLLSESLALAERALIEVEDALGPPGTADPYNVPLAAQTLGLYSTLLRSSHQQLQTLADDLNDARMALAA